VLEERESHRRRVGEVLAALGAAAEEAGDLRAAVRYSREQLALDPLSQDAARALIGRLGRAGDRAGAVAAYRTLREALRRDLDIEPSPQTRALVEELRTEAPSPADARPGPALPTALTRADSGPLVGRRDPLERLRETLAAGQRGRRRDGDGRRRGRRGQDGADRGVPTGSRARPPPVTAPSWRSPASATDA
jgi:hypothetical protein